MKKLMSFNTSALGKRALTLGVLLFAVFTAFTMLSNKKSETMDPIPTPEPQGKNPVKWTWEAGSEEGEIVFTAMIDKGWYIYSQNIEEGGPVPTEFVIEESDGFEFEGKLAEEGKMIEKHDQLFDMVIKKYADKVVFRGKGKLTKPEGSIKGYLTYMTCDDSKCLPPDDVDFSIKLSKKAPAVKGEEGGVVSPPNGAMGIPTSNNSKNPVQWNHTTRKLPNGDYELTWKAKIKKGWWVYSQDLEDGGPLPTEVVFEESADFKLIGIVEEKGDMISKFDKMFNMNLNKYKKEMTLVARVKALKPTSKVSGYLSFMTCDDSKCLPPEDVEFSHNFAGGTGTGSMNGNSGESGASGSQAAAGEKSAEDLGDDKTDPEPASGSGGSQSGLTNTAGDAASAAALLNAGSGDKENTKTDAKAKQKNLKNEVKEASLGVAATLGDKGISYYKNAITDCGKSGDQGKDRALGIIFLLGLAGGFFALFTPCVFPMIPLTVSFFTKSSKTKGEGIKNAILYAVSIIAIYVLLGSVVTAVFGVSALYEMATNPYLNLFFFAIFVVFAISFFGYFEITLPAALVNKADEASDKGGLIGIFFMALTLALVSFSCTGPIVGSVLVDAGSRGELLGPIIGMLGFSVALAVPFAFFAAFPGYLNAMPSSGGWLNTVKVVLGFIELIFALKFFSNADMVMQWGLLPREVFLGIWVILFLALAIYLLGKIRFPHDSPLKKLSPIRLGLAVLSFVAAGYLGYGLMGNPIPLVSGFPPPTFYSLFPNSSDGHHRPIADLAAGMALAEKENKPVLIDFTGWSCVNCRKMEEGVWPQVPDLIDDYVLVSLYVDERVPIDKDLHFTYESPIGTKKVKNVGNFWNYLEVDCFGQVSQPWYVLLDDDGSLLAEMKGYTPNVAEYGAWLQKGIDNYKSKKKFLDDDLSSN